MKPKIYCFGSGWALELPKTIHYLGSFQECIEQLDRMVPGMANRAARDFCTLHRFGYQDMGSA